MMHFHVSNRVSLMVIIRMCGINSIVIINKNVIQYSTVEQLQGLFHPMQTSIRLGKYMEISNYCEKECTVQLLKNDVYSTSPAS